MQLWFARGSEVSIREQLVTQVVLGILGDDLAPGQRLPSTRELARRFHVHPNTISAGYRQLTRESWVEYRRGSGVFVRANKPEMTASSGLALDQMVANLFRSARKAGVPQGVLRARLRQWLDLAAELALQHERRAWRQQQVFRQRTPPAPAVGLGGAGLPQ